MKPAPRHQPTNSDSLCVAWEQPEAFEVYAALSLCLVATDFILSMHGSMGRGNSCGNDLDLMATQWKHWKHCANWSHETKVRDLIDQLTANENPLGLKVQVINRLDNWTEVKIYQMVEPDLNCRIIDLLVVTI